MKDLAIADDFDISSYGKLRGWKTLKNLDLPTFDFFFIMKDLIDINNNKIKKYFGNYPIFCRTDAPIGEGFNLIRGRDVLLADINDYFKEVKKCNKNGIILLSKHPSLLLGQDYTPRYKTNGAFMIVVESGDKVTIEHVGKGFDVGDITRGKSVHTSIFIPWDMLLESINNIFLYTRLFSDYKYEISKYDYLKHRDARISELHQNLGESELCEINNSISYFPEKLSLKLFKKVFRECLESILYTDYSIWGKTFGLMANIYEEELFVFEVWGIERSINDNIILKKK